MTHPVDIHVGRRMKEMRVIRGLTQADVAAKLELSFQQIQKYELGRNRISASRLYELAMLLDVSPAYFFGGLDGAQENDSGAIDLETARVMSDLSRIKNERVKSQLNTFIHELARQNA
jgi:transcriptional regulator with XRE-family HTH domain